MNATPLAQPKAYFELTGRLLEAEDQFKLEWAVGALLDDGPARIVCIAGRSASGKSTLIKIIKRVLTVPDDEQIGRRVVFQGFDTPPIGIDTFVFGESIVPLSDEDSVFFSEDVLINVRTTGDQLPTHKFHVVMEQINTELDAIAQHCVDVYRANPEGIIR